MDKITLNEFIEEHGGYWDGEHSKYCIIDWMSEVQNRDTRCGYWEWVYKQAERDE